MDILLKEECHHVMVAAASTSQISQPLLMVDVSILKHHQHAVQGALDGPRHEGQKHFT
jgi:hypothetical protein